MNSVAVSGNKKTVSIGSGNRWGNVYTKLDEQDLVMVGGRLSQVGVGGLLTGGTLMLPLHFVCSDMVQAGYRSSHRATASLATTLSPTKSSSQMAQSLRRAALRTSPFSVLLRVVTIILAS